MSNFKVGSFVSFNGFDGVVKGVSIDEEYGNEYAVEFDAADEILNLAGAVDESSVELVEKGKGGWIDEDKLTAL